MSPPEAPPHDLPLIEVEGATKRYGSTLAVDAVSFAVRPGEVAGFLGPNGAGKSTLLKLMCTWLAPTAGRIAIAGCDVVTNPLGVRRRLGYLPEHNALWEPMRVLALLRFIGKARGLSGGRLEERLDWAVETCSLQAVTKKRVAECSKGYRQRIGLAAALLHDPPVILLDEPTHGLDPLQVAAFRDFVRELSPGRAILFSSHVLSEVVTISDRLLVIQEGRLLLDETVAALEERSGGRDLEELLLELVRGGSSPERKGA